MSHTTTPPDNVAAPAAADPVAPPAVPPQGIPREKPDRVQILLDQELSTEHVLKHPHSKVSYLPGWYVISRLNEVFGQLGWEMSYEAPTLSMIGERTVTRVAATLTLHHRGRSIRKSDVGFAISADGRPEAVETCVKSAYTDALKRCARTLGPSLGLALYDKAVTTVTAFSAAAMTALAEIEGFSCTDDADRWRESRGTLLKESFSEDEYSFLVEQYRVRRRELAKAGAVSPLVTVPAASPAAAPAAPPAVPAAAAAVPAVVLDESHGAGAGRAPAAAVPAAPAAPAAPKAKPLVEQIVDAIRGAKTPADLKAVRTQWGAQARRLLPAEYERVKTEGARQEASWAKPEGGQ